MILIVGLIGALIGYFARDTRDILLSIKKTVEGFKIRQETEKPPSVGFAEPMTRAELAGQLEEERISLLNG